MAQFFERKPNKQEDQVMTELKRWWARNPSASMLELEAIAKDLGLRGVRRFHSRSNATAPPCASRQITYTRGSKPLSHRPRTHVGGLCFSRIRQLKLSEVFRENALSPRDRAIYYPHTCIARFRRTYNNFARS